MNEYKLISELFGNVKDLFKSDAQIVEIAGQKWGVTCDHFSLEEDLFTSDKPYIMGCNLVTATISDLIASGCKPTFYEHAIVLAKDTKKEWAERLVKGIADTLKEAGCTLIGGDMGQADKFSYTGIALGPQIKNVSRLFPQVEQNLYISGPLGDVNESILTGVSTPKFELRSLPSSVLAAIDTSGGFIDALWQLHTINPNFKIEVSNPPAKDIRFLFGGAGEYELLFTSVEPVNNAILIGKITPGETGVFLNEVEVKNPAPDPRGYENISDYINDIEKITNELFR